MSESALVKRSFALLVISPETFLLVMVLVIECPNRLTKVNLKYLRTFNSCVIRGYKPHNFTFSVRTIIRYSCSWKRLKPIKSYSGTTEGSCRDVTIRK